MDQAYLYVEPRVIKKVVEHDSNTNKNTFVEVDMHAEEQGLPDINQKVNKKHTVSFVETSNQPKYDHCWFDRGHNTVS